MSTVSFGDKSRLIIKNIPNSLDNKLLDKLISKKCRDIGVTKCDLKLLTKEKKVNKEVKRVSRGICYVGFASEKDATKFMKHYDNSYFNSCKVSIEYSKSPGTVEKKEEIYNGVEKVKAKEGGKVVVEKEVMPRKAGVAAKQVHIKFDSEDSDNKESEGDEDFIDRRVERKSVRMEQLEKRDRKNRKELESRENKDNEHVSDEKEVDMNRVVIFNLPYSVTEEAIRSLVKPFGKVEQIHIPLLKYDYSDPSSMESRATKGMCYVTFCFESDAVNFVEQKNKSIFSGRIITIALAKSKHQEEEGPARVEKYHNKRRNEETYSKFKMKKRKEEIGNQDIWNALHIDIHAAIRTISAELGVSSEEILKGEEAGVNVALSESYILNKLKKWLEDQGVNHEAGDYDQEDLHEDTLMIKNLPYNADDRELIRLFGSCGQIVRFATSPYKLLGLVQYSNKHECDRAFRTLSYKMYKSLPIYLQRVAKKLLPNSATIKTNTKLIEEAREGMESDHVDGRSTSSGTRVGGTEDVGQSDLEHTSRSRDDKDATNYRGDDATNLDPDDDNEDEFTKEEENNRIGHVSVYVSNIDASVDEEELEKHFASLKGYVISKIIRPIQGGSDESDKSKADRPRYGFIEFDSIENAKEAIKRRCGTVVAGKLINLELSKNKQTISKHRKKKEGGPTEENDVIIVKNLPFQATKKELSDLFKHYANVKTVRLPKSAGNTHRGFGFVEFMSKSDAKTAMENLKNVHLYGRRLVLQYVENTK
ncbi:uncharacterized protein TOT_040000506 [Theileria orientalis strain Shintoku]|uniref:RRM domain-containing protein n=1 Tax=Theileria orientalis strain Shintoku TaxID=869250 RepID=J4C4G3_THEOR|nr:uncharacterized protein TOT_040000506 [Theileria orientalis strain Shintoku]BAM42136.1 uncharacterized protein TOT_040000506 [Theileria orientalis strain Shintoku]|eukprot:XP_009692437.1 uncharacterized protein TOT_040000506 [Theileria orientalis strain Shintoku]